MYIYTGCPKKSGNKDFLAQIRVLEPGQPATYLQNLILSGVYFITFFPKMISLPRK